ncbi:uncharacterized protein H6S33_011039 [Morchella sextelata]|uniref:uncharacterized protein n=1 Tax=Morchella sextelata TaxID=1174677 RepID=UPI001D04B5DC|nr:uncharacterized protein H6S33_011039 [Morchella sextelata]KAH0611774.1 hypothetical protein H6S33_011039 [Morchella sextelata]
MSAQPPKSWKTAHTTSKSYYLTLPAKHYSEEIDRPYFNWDGDSLRIVSGKITKAEREVQSFMNLTAEDEFPFEQIEANYRYIATNEIFIDYYRYLLEWDEINAFRTLYEQRVDIIVLQRLKDRALEVSDTFEECVEHIADLVTLKAKVAPPVFANYYLLAMLVGAKHMEKAWKTHNCLWICAREAKRMIKVVKRKGEVKVGSESKSMTEIVHQEGEEAAAEMGGGIKPGKLKNKVKDGMKSKGKGREKIKAKERLEEYRRMVLKGGSGGNE